jgi:hypothetical protein
MAGMIVFCALATSGRARGAGDDEAPTDGDLMFQALKKEGRGSADDAVIGRVLAEGKRESERKRRALRKHFASRYWRDPWADDPTKPILIPQPRRDGDDDQARLDARARREIAAARAEAAMAKADAARERAERARAEARAARSEARAARVEALAAQRACVALNNAPDRARALREERRGRAHAQAFDRPRGRERDDLRDVDVKVEVTDVKLAAVEPKHAHRRRVAAADSARPSGREGNAAPATAVAAAPPPARATPPSTAPAGWQSHDPRGIIVVPLATAATLPAASR